MRTLTLILSLALSASGAAQTFNESVRTAERLAAEGNYPAAAGLYERAGRLKTSRPELLLEAAENYARARDYRKAADCYQSIENQYARYEFAGLRHARALKQTGRYREAIETFRRFGKNYSGERRAEVDALVQTEIKGCEMAIQSTASKAQRPSIDFNLLPQGVNSPENEFGILPFSEEALYFSTLKNGQPAFYRATRQNGQWWGATAATALPDSLARHFGTGAFSPDGQRFYCTQCQPAPPGATCGNGLHSPCTLVALKKKPDGSGWSAPMRLPAYINLPGSTVLHPAVVHDRDQEYLFFASDRPGGLGGLDLFWCSRPLDADAFDFSLPQNLGDRVNTAGDEISPWFSASTQTLYFSSNAQAGLGGFDVFKSVRAADGRWTRAENLGPPFNSPADDLFFVGKDDSGEAGFLSSNRLFGAARTDTRDEDIFEFAPQKPPVSLTGQVYDAATGAPVPGCVVALYEEAGDGAMASATAPLVEQETLLAVQPARDGIFRFGVAEGKKYRLEAHKDGFAPSLFRVDGSKFAEGEKLTVNMALRPLGK